MVQHSDINHAGVTGVPDLSAHTGDTDDAHDASAISFSPTGTIAATDVQAAIAEVASEAAGGSFDPDIHLPWHELVLPQVVTPDATTGTWALIAFTENINYPFLNPAGTSVGAGALYNSSTAQNDAIAWDLILAAGTWDAHFHVRKSSNTGIITLQQAGADQGTVDTYAAAAAFAKVSVTGFTVATTGKKRMNVKAATKNASSSGYLLELYAIEFRRTA